MMEDLSLHVLDLAENAMAAGATRIAIAVDENQKTDILVLRVTDDGRGMTAEEKRLALDPFFTTKSKKTGLGLALLAQTAGQSGGGVAVDSARSKGTRVTASFRYSHIDRPPLSKMAETLMLLVFGHPEVDIVYRHRRNGKLFIFESGRFFGRAGAGPAWSPENIRAARETLRDGLKKIGAG